MLFKKMQYQWTQLGIEAEFTNVHHFSSSEFSCEPSTFKAFISYCEDVKIRGENAQTVSRALDVGSQINKGILRNDAIKASWKRYPLVTRDLNQILKSYNPRRKVSESINEESTSTSI